MDQPNYIYKEAYDKVKRYMCTYDQRWDWCHFPFTFLCLNIISEFGPEKMPHFPVISNARSRFLAYLPFLMLLAFPEIFPVM